MRFEDLQVTGSYQVTGSLNIPFGQASDRPTGASGSLFFNVSSSGLETFDGVQWTSGSEGSGGEGGDAATFTASDIEYLVIAGGGGGGGRYYGGGGGAGGYLSSSILSTNSSISSGSTFTITVGAGGSGGSTLAVGGNGGDSSIAATGLTTITATGGGGGEGGTSSPAADGGSGGGGNQWGSTYHLGGSGTSGQGFDGGDNAGSGTYHAGAGGGGASEAGNDSTNTSANVAGKGGDGLASKITGNAVTRGGGGGGAMNANNVYFITLGGSGGGGRGAADFLGSQVQATAGAANSGSGGGGGCHSGTDNGAAGGSGIVVLAYDSGSMDGAGGIKGNQGNGRRYHVFNSSDTFLLSNVGDFDVVTDSLQAHYDAGDFASRGTSTFTDLSGNSNNGTVSGATLGANWYYDFDGSNDKISITAITPITVEMWVRPDSTGGIDGLLGHSSITANYMYWNTGDVTVNGTIFTDVDKVTTWTHIVVKESGSNLIIYVNGSETQTLSGALGTYNEFGGRTSGTPQYLNGRIGQVRFYNKALTSAEVLQNYNATKTNFV